MSLYEHDERDLRSLLVFWICRLLLKTVMILVPIGEANLRRIKVVDRLAARAARPIHGVEVRADVIAGAPVERITPDRIDAERTAVLYMHGGAFIACGLDSHRPVASAVARKLGVRTVNVQYRQCPEAGVGTSVGDCYRVYRALRESGDFDRIVVAGDSAGGYAAAKVVEYSALDDVAGPDAYIGFSPLLNISPTADRDSSRDAMIPIAKLEKLRPFYDRGPDSMRGPLDTTRDEVAAVFPPAVIICARDEALQKDATDMRAALDRAGVDNELHIYAGQIHAFPAAATSMTQAKNAIAVSVDFVRRALADAETADEAASA